MEKVYLQINLNLDYFGENFRVLKKDIEGKWNKWRYILSFCMGIVCIRKMLVLFIVFINLKYFQ